MSWTGDLIDGIYEGFKRGGPQRIAVHTDGQASLGQIAAGRLADRLPGYVKVDDLTFEVVPEHIPLGSILV
mgnify:CR=1 FL=1